MQRELASKAMAFRVVQRPPARPSTFMRPASGVAIDQPASVVTARAIAEIADSETSDKQGGRVRVGRERIRTALTRLKTVVLAPMPRARVSTAIAVSPGFFRNALRAEAQLAPQRLDPG